MRVWPSSTGARSATAVYVLAAGLAIGVGVYFRTVGVFTDRFSFWLDEAVWARLVRADDWYRHGIRPLGYLAISRILVRVHDTELPLRMLAYVPGVVSLVLLFFVLRRLLLCRALIVAGLLIVATHPSLIDYSREYKPYALSVFVHLALVLSTLSYIQDRGWRRLVLAAGLACLSPLFAIDAVFALPGVLVVLLVGTSRERSHRYRIAMVVTGIVALAVVASLYVFVWHTEMRPAIVAHWAQKYGVFYAPGGYVPDHVLWLWQRTRAVVLWATLSHGNFEIPGQTRLAAGALLAVVPLALWNRQLMPVILLAGPIMTTLACHLLGWWPWGPFRTNQFLIVYIVLTILYSFELFERGLSHRLGSIAVTVIAVTLIAVHFPTDLRAHDRKWIGGDSAIKKALEVIREHHVRHEAEPRRAHKIPLVAGRHAGPVIEYYTQQHAHLRHRLAFIRDEYQLIGVSGWGMEMWGDRRIPSGALWVVTEHPVNTNAAKRHLERHCDVEILKLLPGDDLVAYARCP